MRPVPSATIGTTRRIETVQFGVIESEANGQITEYREKPNLDYLVSMGIYVFAPEVRDFIPARSEIRLSRSCAATAGQQQTRRWIRNHILLEGYWPP